MAERNLPAAVGRSAVRTVAEWESVGVSPRRLRTLVASGDLVKMRRGVYATKAAVDMAAKGPRQRHRLDVFSTLAAVGFDTVVSHQSAAFIQGLDLLGLGKDQAPAEVTLTREGTGRRNRTGIENAVCYAAKLPPGHVQKLGGMKVTTVKRTVIDLARTLPFMDAVVVADSALRVHEFTESEYEPVLKSCSGWPGAAHAREVMEFADPGTDSVLESCLRVFLRDWGFDPPETQVTIHGENANFTVDFFFREQNTVVEADGDLKYTQQKAYLNRLARDEALHAAGCKVVHVSWSDAFKEPQFTASRIRKALAAPGPFLPAGTPAYAGLRPLTPGWPGCPASGPRAVQRR